MKIHDFHTANGKNVIKDYLHNLPAHERTYGYKIRHKIIEDGLKAFDGLDTRQLKGKLWEIKFSANRIMYVIQDGNNVYFLHVCKKQKGKAEKFELETAINRAKEKGFEI